MYTAKDAVTFADVESMLGVFLKQEELEISVANEADLHKKTKRIIGDISHYYMLVGTKDGETYRDKVNKVVDGLKVTYPDVCFSLRDWEPLDDGVRGYSLRVGATPPTDVSLTQPAIDAMLENVTEA